MQRIRPAYKALTSDSWDAHSHPAGWARSSLESRASRSPAPACPDSPKPLILVAASRSHRCRTRDGSTAGAGALAEQVLDGARPRLARRRPRRQDLPVHCYREALKDDPRGSAGLRDAARRSQPRTPDHHPTARRPCRRTTRSVGAGRLERRRRRRRPSGTSDQRRAAASFHWVAHTLGPNTADSIPVPLLVLGGLALALMAAAGVSFCRSPGAGPAAAADGHPTSFRLCSRPEIPLRKRPRGYHRCYVRGCFYGPDPDRRRLLEDAPPHRSRSISVGLALGRNRMATAKTHRDSGTRNTCG